MLSNKSFPSIANGYNLNIKKDIQISAKHAFQIKVVNKATFDPITSFLPHLSID